MRLFEKYGEDWQRGILDPDRSRCLRSVHKRRSDHVPYRGQPYGRGREVPLCKTPPGVFAEKLPLRWKEKGAGFAAGPFLFFVN